MQKCILFSCILSLVAFAPVASATRRNIAPQQESMSDQPSLRKAKQPAGGCTQCLACSSITCLCLTTACMGACYVDICCPGAGTAAHLAGAVLCPCFYYIGITNSN